MQNKDVLTLKGVVSSRGDASRLLIDRGDAVLVFRECFRWLVMRCPDGCGEELAINLDRRAGPAWRLYRDQDGVSLYPSVQRDSGCRSHFIIYDNQVIWCRLRRGESALESADVPLRNGLERRIIALLTERQMPVHFVEIADLLNEQPWAIWVCCRKLERAGKIVQGVGPDHDQFSTRPANC